MSTKTITAEELVGRMERLPFSRMHKKIYSLTAAGYLFDAFDIMLLSFVMPALAKDLGLTPVQIGLSFSVSFLGMFGGALSGYTGRHVWQVEDFQSHVAYFFCGNFLDRLRK